MKRIAIHINDGQNIMLRDDDSRDLNEYSTELSQILNQTSVVILKTSESATILRPTRIDCIEVFEYDENNDLVNSVTNKKPIKPLTSPKKKIPKLKKGIAKPANTAVKKDPKPKVEEEKKPEIIEEIPNSESKEENGDVIKDDN